MKSEVLKSGIWYTISDFLLKGFGFITVPFFARMMSKAEFGDYSNFGVWCGIISIICSFSLAASINKGRLDFPGQIDKFCSSILVLGICITCVVWLIVCLNIDYFSTLFGLGRFYIHMVFLSVLFGPIVGIFQVQQRVLYKYKVSVGITVVSTIVSLVLSVYFVIFCSDKFYGRVIGQVIPTVFMGICVGIWLLYRGQGISISHCKYALNFCWPFIPHLFSLGLLTSIPKMAIMKYFGNEYLAVFSLACTFMMLGDMFHNSMNMAIAPWIFEMLSQHREKEIRDITAPYFLMFFVPIAICFLIVPEAIYVFAGKQYIDAQWFVPSLMTAIFFSFAYVLYVNIEQYSRKTWAVAGGSAIAAAVSLFLNYCFLQKWGYYATGYVMMIVYMVLFLVHFTFVRVIGYKDIYDDKVVFAILGTALMWQGICLWLYNYTYPRWGLFMLLFAGCVVYVLKNKDRIKRLFNCRDCE